MGKNEVLKRDSDMYDIHSVTILQTTVSDKRKEERKKMSATEVCVWGGQSL